MLQKPRESFSIPTFKNFIAIFRISLSNAKWIWISLESLIEHYLYTKFIWITLQEV